MWKFQKLKILAISSGIKFELAEAIPTQQPKPFDLFRRAFLFSGIYGL